MADTDQRVGAAEFSRAGPVTGLLDSQGAFGVYLRAALTLLGEQPRLLAAGAYSPGKTDRRYLCRIKPGAQE